MFCVFAASRALHALVAAVVVLVISASPAAEELEFAGVVPARLLVIVHGQVEQSALLAPRFLIIVSLMLLHNPYFKLLIFI